ncbi:iron complex outermembrane receptor protein [Chitinophaga terrae (ex Kim and Jung 2007)]|uniref:TonB-dependent receptor n=1 Tax=Chitinophaga terrae (ex Kim and Jung 2007) TaxID=408074 RepID=UPI0027834F52|nr:TonB-dependent receptor [Chitinophaga terrae (ex Kim and Jung 2007)]MDQ0108778.1 iron complex outermembrane receptor protein [Chitinophaga terrae (ex Kim and Jung 2007)]
MGKFFTSVLLFFTFTTAAWAQSNNGTIRGKVTTSDGAAAGFVTVQIKQNSRGTVSDEKGNFIFRRVTPGEHTIEVSFVGYEPLSQVVTVRPNETTEVTLHLQVSNTQLSEVQVIGGRNKLANKESEQVAKLPLKYLENPQVYNVINKDVLKQQVVSNFDDALKNAPGVNKLWSSTGRPGDGAGYFSMRGFSVQPTMVNGVAGVSNASIDPADLERIEVIKGPSGTLFGSSLVSFGGLINLVTKKPYDAFGGEISYTGGGFGLNRITADFNTPLNKEKTVLLRTNAAYHSENSFQDAGFKRSFFLAPSLTYKVNDRLTFNVNTEFFTGESTNTLMIFLNRGRQLIAKNPSELGMDYNRSFTSNDITYKNPTVNLFGQAVYKLSDKWTSQTNISRSIRKSNGYFSYVMFLDAGVAPNDTLLSRFVYHQNSTTTATDVQQNFIGDFRIGSLRNRVVMGLDFLSLDTRNDNSPYLLFDNVSAVNKLDPRYGMLNRQAVDAKLAASTDPGTHNRAINYTYSAYISDVLNITDKLAAMASLRVDHFVNRPTQDYTTSTKGTDDYSQTAVSPKFGLTYEIVKNKLSLFANYMNGFSNVAPVVQPLPELSGNFKPQQANQVEGGVKADLLNNRLTLTASYYNILVKNMTRGASIVKDGTTYNYTIQDGSQRSKGVEFDLIANPIAGLSVVAGYGYNDSKMVDADPDVEGLRPVSAGPQHLANWWLSYTLPKGAVHGLGIGFGGNYASENIITNTTTTGKFTLPSYTILNASVYYQVKSYRLALKLDNLTNKEYFGGWSTVEKQMPRRLSANVTFAF